MNKKECLEQQVATRLMTQSEAANYLNTSVGVLNTWRSIGKQKLPFVHWGRSIRYKKEDLDTWIENQTENKPEDKKGL